MNMNKRNELPIHSHMSHDPSLPSETMKERPWHSSLEGLQRDQALTIALQVATRLQDPEQVVFAAQRAEQHLDVSMHWLQPATLAGGFTGIALLYSYLNRCFPGQGWEKLARRYLKSVAVETQRAPIRHPSLFTGTGGLAFTLQMLSADSAVYQKTLIQVRQLLCEQVIRHRWRKPAAPSGVAELDYDTITGASGILAVLLTLEQPDEQVLAAIETSLAYLTWLTAPDQPLGQERWFIPLAQLPAVGEHRTRFPAGRFNYGLAHGIPGPLAALSLAWMQGYRYPGLRESIMFLSTWLIQHQVEDKYGHNWPSLLPLEAAGEPETWRALPGAEVRIV